MATSTLPTLRRALLYVPASSPKFLTKSLTLTSDNVTYDLEDAVTPDMKPAARTAIQEHLSALSKQATPPSSIGEITVRINAVTTPHAVEDIRAVAALPNLSALVIPKVTSAAELALVEDIIRQAAPHRTEPGNQPIKLLALIESAQAVMDLRAICSATPNLKGLIFGAEDFAQDLSLQRSADMREMLYARSAIVTAARAFGLESAIDAVCTRFRGDDARKHLKRESENGRSLGFNGKQCIHPDQVDYVQRLFSPGRLNVQRATQVVMAAEKAAAEGQGAWSMGDLMIDAPVVARARAVLARAQQCGIDLDDYREQSRKQVKNKKQALPDTTVVSPSAKAADTDSSTHKPDGAM